jgi:hypothetical protein
MSSRRGNGHGGAADNMGWQGYGKRILGELLALQARTGQRHTLAWLGQRIAELEVPPRDQAYDASSVKKWIDEAREPPLRAFAAMALLFGVSAAELAFGREPAYARRVAEPEPAEAAVPIPRSDADAKRPKPRRRPA